MTANELLRSLDTEDTGRPVSLSIEQQRQESNRVMFAIHHHTEIVVGETL